jgi:hypothetical protein
MSKELKTFVRPADTEEWSVQEYLNYLNEYTYDYFYNKSDIYWLGETIKASEIQVGYDLLNTTLDLSGITPEILHDLYPYIITDYESFGISRGFAYIIDFVYWTLVKRSADGLLYFYVNGYMHYTTNSYVTSTLIFTYDFPTNTITWEQPWSTNKKYVFTEFVDPAMEDVDRHFAVSIQKNVTYADEDITPYIDAFWDALIVTSGNDRLGVDCEFLHGQLSTVTEALGVTETHIAELDEKKSNIYEMAGSITVPELQNGFDILNTIIDFSAITKDVIRDAVRSPNAINRFYALRPSNTINYKDCYLTFYSLAVGSDLPDEEIWELYAGGTIYEDDSNPSRIPQDGVKIFEYNGFHDELTWEPAFVDNKTFQFTASLTGFVTNHKFDSIESPEGLVNIFAKLITVASGDGTLDIDCQFLSNQIASLTNTVGNIDANLSNMIYGIKADQPWYKINSLDEVKVLDTVAQHMEGKIGYLPQYDAYFVYLQLINVEGIEWYYGAYNYVPKLVSDKFSEPMEAVSLGPVNNLGGIKTLGITPMDFLRWQDGQGALFVSMALTPASSGFMWINFWPQTPRLVVLPDPSLTGISGRLAALEAKLPDAPDGMIAPMVLTAEEVDTNE